jgi:hypothetical protein
VEIRTNESKQFYSFQEVSVKKLFWISISCILALSLAVFATQTAKTGSMPIDKAGKAIIPFGGKTALSPNFVQKGETGSNQRFAMPQNPVNLSTDVETVILSEGFEGGTLPAGWTDSPGTSPWLFNAGTSGSPNPGAPHTGSFAACFNIYSYPTGTIDTLITPVMDLSAYSGSYIVSFWGWDAPDPYGYVDSAYFILCENGVNTTYLGRLPITSSWTQTGFQFTSTSTAAQIKIVGYSDYGYTDPYIDDFVVEEFVDMGRCCSGNPHAPTCTDIDETGCNTLGGTWTYGLTCATDPCVASPLNDQVFEAQAITGPYPQTITGTTVGATVDCPGLLDWNGVWYTISLPYAYNKISVDFCPTTTAEIQNVGIVVMPDDGCSLYTVGAYVFDSCAGTGLVQPTVTWIVEGPGTVYFPCLVEPAMAFGFDINVESFAPDYTISLPAALPYSVLDQTTCGMGNDLAATCLGYYDGGEDVVYQLDVTVAGCYEFEINTDSTYAGMALSDHFPLDTACLAYVSHSSAGSLIMTGQELAVGTYFLMLDVWPSPPCIDYDLFIRSCTPPPANDSCQNAQVVGNVTNLPWSTAFATPDSNAYIYSNDIWFSYTATSSATVLVSLCGSSFDTKLQIFEGASCDPLGPIVAQDDDSCDPGLQSYAHFSPTSGQTYLIQVGGYSTNSGDGVLTIEAGDPIFNVTPTSISGTAPLNGSDTDTLTVTNTGTATLNFTAIGTQDPFLRRNLDAIRNSLNGAKDASIATKTTEVLSPMAIAPGYAGNAIKEKPTSNVIPPAPDPNMILQGGDVIASATVIPSLPYTDAGTTVGYAHNYDEVCPYGPHTSPDVVYSFTPAVDTYIVADLCNSAYDTKMFIYQDGETPGSPVACNDDACGTSGWRSQIGRTRIYAGSTYYIVIDGYGGASGTYEFNMDYTTAPPLPPVNDECVNAIQISDFPAVVNGTTDGATVDCPGGLDWNAVWYKFDAPYASNTVNLNFCDNSVTLSPIGIILYPACPVDAYACTTTYIPASSYNFTSCPGVTNATMQWMNLPGPATYYLPIITGNEGSEQAFTLNLDVVNFEPCEITCPTGSIPEVELCGEDLNGGCNATVPAFESVAENQTICGTVFADGSTRDTDWYIFVADHAATITVTGVAEFPYQLLIIDAGSGDCTDYAIIAAGTADPCSTATASISVPAGTYYIWAGPSVFAGIACDGSGTYTNEYYFTVTTTPVWLALATEGSIPAGGDPVKVPVFMDGYGLAAGTYTGNIRFETNDPLNATYDVPVTFTITSGGTCDYLIGDISGDNQRLGGDVTYGVRYFKGIGVRPPDSCYMDSTGTYLYVAGDCNGNCEFRGSDITRLVAYFKGNAALSCCHWFPTTLPPILRNTHPTDPAKAE